MIAFSGNLTGTKVFYVDDVINESISPVDVENLGIAVRVTQKLRSSDTEIPIADGHVLTQEPHWGTSLLVMLRLLDGNTLSNYVVEQKVVDDALGINEWRHVPT